MTESERENALEPLRPVLFSLSGHRQRGILILAYLIALIAVVGALSVGYRTQIERRLNELNRELRVSFESVVSGVAATPELFVSRVSDDPYVTDLVQRANTAPESEFEALHDELLLYLRDDYRLLRSLEFRQIHFHLRDNRSFVRFHRPEKFGDDLTDVRATVRETNSSQLPTHGFEEGRIFNGFRFVYPLFHNDEHVGSVEASVNIRAIVSRTRLSRPAIQDFVISRNVVDEKVFVDERGNYIPSCFSNQFAREAGFEIPDTETTLGVSFTCIWKEGRSPRGFIDSLESYQADSFPIVVGGVPIAVSVLPIRNFRGNDVALIISYSRFDEMTTIRSFFVTLGIILGLLSSLIFVLVLRIMNQRQRLFESGRTLQRTINTKNRFFSIISHDLRGPMGSLSGLSGLHVDELRTTENLPSTTLETAEAIAEGSNRAFNLLTDLLDWSRSQGGEIAFRPDELDVGEIVESQVATLHRIALSKGISVHNTVESSCAYADGYMIKTVVRNLLSNAIKFTPEGGTITIATHNTTDGTSISVADTGVGMTEQQQRDVFDLSVKMSTPGTHAEAGTGLGLTVCNEFVQQHDGSITIESEIGVGTTFRVFLPKRTESK